jgi:TusA-related sulfurtransferase
VGDFLGVKRVRDGKRAITLCYRATPLERLFADMAIMARGLSHDTILRVYTDHEEALTLAPEWATQHGYTLLLARCEEEREGDQCPFGRYRLDICSR